jgi:hypothetical protein
MLKETSSLALGVALLAFACGGGGSDPDRQPTPRSTADASTSSINPASPKLVKVRATVRYDGGRQGPLAVGLFTENPPKTRPPVAFDTTTKPTYPYTAELRGIEPGHYWAFAVIDLPPVVAGAVVPGPEDLVTGSEGIDIGTSDAEVEIVVSDLADAGSD